MPLVEAGPTITNWPPSPQPPLPANGHGGIGGYHGSLVSNGGRGDAWRSTRRGDSPVFSNGVLVPRPFLWACNTSSMRGGGTSTNGRPSDAAGDVIASISGDSGGGRNGGTRSRTECPCPESLAQPQSPVISGSPASTERLAWCGDQRSLPRPSATLQLRRHTSPASSAARACPSRLSSEAQSTAAAVYFGRLDLTSECELELNPNSDRSRGGDGAWTKKIERHTARRDSGKARTSGIVGERDTGYVRAKTRGGRKRRKVRVDSFSGSSSVSSRSHVAASASRGQRPSATEDASTLSSSGPSMTSGDDGDTDNDDDEEEDPDFQDGTGSLENHDPAAVSNASSVLSMRSDSNRSRLRTRPASSLSSSAESDLPIEEAIIASADVKHAISAVRMDPKEAMLATQDSRHMVGSAGPGRARADMPVSPGCRPVTSSPRGMEKDRLNTKSSPRKLPEANASRTTHKECSDRVTDHPSKEIPAPAPARVRPPRVRSKTRSPVREPLVPPQPPSGPRKWPARPPNRALVYAAAAQASRRARGFTGWSFPALPPPPPPPPRLPTPPPILAVVVLDAEADTEASSEVESNAGQFGGESGEQGDRSNSNAGEGENDEAEETVVSAAVRKSRRKWNEPHDAFLGRVKDNAPGAPSPNELGWVAIDPMHTAEGRIFLKQRAIERKRQAIEAIARRKREELERRRLELERIAMEKRQQILDALRIKVWGYPPQILPRHGLHTRLSCQKNRG